MPALDIQLEGDGCWPDLKEMRFDSGQITGIAYLKNGMVSGNPSVTVRAALNDGRIVLVETSLKLFLAAASAFRAKANREGIDV